MFTRYCRTLLLLALASSAQVRAQAPQQPVLGGDFAPRITIKGLVFRDLNRDGQLNPYEDWRLPDEVRASDLVARMTLEEKAGAMMHGSLPGLGNRIGASAEGYDLPALEADLGQRHVTSFITRLAVSPARMAEENNKVQSLAERQRLGIPVTVSTDPRHHFQVVIGNSVSGSGYSQWPETLGFGALRDPELMRRFAAIARAEYRATGIQQALSPQADLFTEPRWPRGTGTFGADPAVTRSLVQAYVEGFQGAATGLARHGVLTVVKHWVGYGATPGGWDGHNYYGRYVRVSDASLAAHISAFEGAFRVKVAGVMPTYSIVEGATVGGKPLEPVGAGLSHQLLTDLLRGTHGYRGIILSDWAITNDCGANCRDAATPQGFGDIGMPWGVEDLTRLQRFAKGINAGIDQFGGETDSTLVVTAVHNGLVGEARVDQSVIRIMLPKFRMGLFENPYVDPARAAHEVNPPAVQRQALAAQSAAQVLLKNDGVFPLRPGTRVWLHDIAPAAARSAGLVVVDAPEQAEVALVRLATPYQTLHPNNFFGSRQHEGRLDFRSGEAGYELVKRLEGKTRVAVALFADRPAVLGEIDHMAKAILVNFGISDEALISAVTGKARICGHLPFELPSSMAAVEAQDPALPDDSAHPLYRTGFGLTGRGCPIQKR